MSYEFHTQYSLALYDSLVQAKIIDWLVGKSSYLPPGYLHLANIEDWDRRVELLAQTLVTPYKQQARSGTRTDQGGYAFWLRNKAPDFFSKQRHMLRALGCEQLEAPDFTLLPPQTCFFHFTFTLRRPYMSKDDTDLHILDHPVKKEHLFKLPYVAASQWKGSLRSALWRLGHQEDNQIVVRLFGHAREGEEGQAGRLYFYPTFFEQIALEVINPHDRETGVGERGPILMECVPAGAKGIFSLLYIPFNIFSRHKHEEYYQVADDLMLVAEGLQAMFTVFGFGAKTGSGYGLAEDNLAEEGSLTLRAELSGLSALTEDSERDKMTFDLPRYLESSTQLHSDFRREDGSLKSESEYEAVVKSRGGTYGKKEKQLYDKARKWWEREGRKFLETRTGQSMSESESAPTPHIYTYAFTSFTQLVDVMREVSNQLKQHE